MNKFNKKRNIYITIAIITILLIGLGYAFLTSNLNIIGNTNINKNTWGVEFENIQVTEGSVEADTPQISNKTTVNYTVTLDKPGDYYEFTVDASNKGSIDAMIDSVSNTGLTTEQKKYLEYSATYDDGTEIKKKQELKAGSKEKIQVRVEYKKDITAEDLPNDNQQLNLTFTIEYVQADDSSTVVEHPICKRATKLHTETCTNTDQYACGGVGGRFADSVTVIAPGGYSSGDTITYGSLGTAGTLTSGDAFDCDVNGDGEYNSSNERFYYVSSLDTDNNYGVLIYYNNVSGGEPNNTATYAYDSTSHNASENGPITAVQQLPTTSQWKNVRLSNTTRKIKDELGTEYIDFSYEGYSARLLMIDEIKLACNISDLSKGYKYGVLDQCKYFMENTRYSNKSLKWGYYLESISSIYQNRCWSVAGRYSEEILRGVGSTQPRPPEGVTEDSPTGVRPVIEVPKSRISY